MIEWISVEDRLPEREINCLVFTLSDGVAKGCFYKGKFIHYKLYGASEVTHWAEINEPENK